MNKSISWIFSCRKNGVEKIGDLFFHHCDEVTGQYNWQLDIWFSSIFQHTIHCLKLRTIYVKKLISVSRRPELRSIRSRIYAYVRPTPLKHFSSWKFKFFVVVHFTHTNLSSLLNVWTLTHHHITHPHIHTSHFHIPKQSTFPASCSTVGFQNSLTCGRKSEQPALLLSILCLASTILPAVSVSNQLDHDRDFQWSHLPCSCRKMPR